eukprot:1101354-Pleurochrysis_carterae.AAC.2
MRGRSALTPEPCGPEIAVEHARRKRASMCDVACAVLGACTLHLQGPGASRATSLSIPPEYGGLQNSTQYAKL